ncbi:DNA/RNA non-specific endonuclease [Kamptonema formosum]|uniref:DNA/RNA non-specific endonuclease n=1 Tax=Kamptonema formosum TaxID=331992 RepID=UPI001E56C5FB|nr:DNA/RNA non-specific endonuclease [Oscillatoria sp. PCC 10802]
MTAQGDRKIVTDKFKTLLPQPAAGSNTFSSVTVLTRGFEPISGYKIDQQFEAMAKHIVSDGGSIVSYNSETGKWNPVKGSGSPKLGKPLVLIPGWEQSPAETALNSGFAEAAADAFFASLVQLDQSLGGSVGEGSGSGLKLYNNEGDLIRTMGSLFQSPLHFIGFGQGAVINSEIVQRLGTFFPKKDYSNAFPDIQMTTVDPHDFLQESLWSQSVRDPQVKVWENVTFADNYYQDVIPATEPKTFTFNGREIEGADLNVSLGNWAGFTEVDDKKGGNHRQALAWYAGTANLSGSQLPAKDGEYIYRRLGDLEPADRTPNSDKIWYTPDYRGYPFIHGSQNAPWEGIGTGWFHSVLGGGKDKRRDPLLGVRTSVSEDNTAEARMRGDFAVPTLFNGNFDAISTLRSSQSIPGWSFYNGNSDTLSQSYLVEWSKINGLTKVRPIRRPDNKIVESNYLEQLGIYERNYALRLENNQSVTHNRFVVPEWGALRFNLHVPQLTGGQVRVSIKGENDTKYQTIGTVTLSEAVNNDGINTNSNSYLEDRFRIGFGSEGFETFLIDDSESEVLRNLRGKVATLKFEVTGGTVFLDDVFFKSEHLKFGLPTYNEQEARPDAGQLNNYLIEKPQYAVSYNNSSKNPNWVSWQLNPSWLGNVPRKGTWNPDRTLPASFEPLAVGQDYRGVNYMDTGHMTASMHRNRAEKDMFSTFLTTNAIPQATGNNTLDSSWENLENFSQILAAEKGKELFITAGGYGTSTHPLIPSSLSSQNINVPSFTWKNILALDLPRLALEDIGTVNQLTPEKVLFEDPISPENIKKNTVISVITPNISAPESVLNSGSFPFPHPLNNLLPPDRHRPDFTNLNEWNNWRNWTVLTEDINRLTNLNLFTNLNKV